MVDRHKTYGDQLKITKAPIFDAASMSKIGVRNILETVGVSPMVAYGITNAFGDNSYTILNSDDAHEALQSLSGVNSISADFILKKWQDYIALHQSFAFFEAVGLSHKKYQDVFSYFGVDAKRILSKDPYLLVAVSGITFEQADAVASHLGISKSSPKRILGLVLSSLKENRTMGHLYLTPRQIFEAARRKVPSLSCNEAISSIVQTSGASKSTEVDRATGPETIGIIVSGIIICASHLHESSCEDVVRIKRGNFVHDLLDVKVL